MNSIGEPIKKSAIAAFDWTRAPPVASLSEDIARYAGINKDALLSDVGHFDVVQISEAAAKADLVLAFDRGCVFR